MIAWWLFWSTIVAVGEGLENLSSELKEADPIQGEVNTRLIYGWLFPSIMLFLLKLSTKTSKPNIKIIIFR